MTTTSIQWNTFVLRLWNDTTTGTWRGEIVHLPSRESSHFASWEQAGEFVRRFAPGLEWKPPAFDVPTDVENDPKIKKG
ncbi:MAG: hypothetical protein N2117_08145 [Anaerolineales bacterium]|nr:hypothetical protein [Anaerolineales bacterium]MCX7755204.1 hypothetical protein [Anaerolineales bacterium]MDW8278803.1 hypothetical protein [Anaerolineales bacterium]